MRVLQLIDSLEAGGAERMAVNFANALSTKIDASYLCTTRKEGLLKESLQDNVGYLFLNKKGRIDFKAIFKLYRFIKTKKISIIHAHSTSFFLATIISFLNFKLKIIWHDHYGDNENLHNRKFRVLSICSKYFAHIFSVNKNLESWAIKHLKTKSVSYLPNFAFQQNSTLEQRTILLKEKGKRIINLANLRPQKDHLNLLKAFTILIKECPDWSLHLVGKDFNDNYSKAIKEYIEQNNLAQSVFIYGSCPDISNILSQSTIGVLSSKSEGLPLALLEYGMAGLPAVVTNVGDCNKVISNSNEGVLVEPKNHKALSKALLKLIEDTDLRKLMADNLHQKVVSSFSESSSIATLIKIYKQYQ
jgi:glycosyltransferase involved in cell wall biosynthesis